MRVAKLVAQSPAGAGVIRPERFDQNRFGALAEFLGFDDSDDDDSPTSFASSSASPPSPRYSSQEKGFETLFFVKQTAALEAANAKGGLESAHLERADLARAESCAAFARAPGGAPVAAVAAASHTFTAAAAAVAYSSAVLADVAHVALSSLFTTASLILSAFVPSLPPLAAAPSTAAIEVTDVNAAAAAVFVAAVPAADVLTAAAVHVAAAGSAAPKMPINGPGNHLHERRPSQHQESFETIFPRCSSPALRVALR